MVTHTTRTHSDGDSNEPNPIAGVPIWPHDLYAESVLREPQSTYRELRTLGPVVWLEKHGVYALPRYAEVRAALAAPDLFCSSQGVALNPMLNEFARGVSVLMSDGAQHRKLRGQVATRLTPRSLKSLLPEVERVAAELVDELVERGSFDAVTDLAIALPLKFVPDLIGWPKDNRENLLPWAAAAFDLFGPPEGRAQDALPRFAEMIEYTEGLVSSRNVLPGSVAERLLEAADRGEIPLERCPKTMLDYLAPSLDTTISSISGAIELFARYPDQWDAVRADHSLIPSAYNEVVRVTSPVNQFMRVTTRSTDMGGVTLPEGVGVMMMFASANWDDDKWERADIFDVRRNPVDHLGFGYGSHGCVGQGLARLEGHAVIAALASRVSRFYVGSAVRAINNSIIGLESLPTTVEPTAKNAA
jgi:cytochrome P450